MEYVINGVNDNNEQIIEKRGHVITFTINEVIAHKERMAKALKELSSTKQVLDAKAQNVIDFHPEVKDMSAEQLFNAWFYKEQTDKSAEYAKKIAEIEKLIKEYDEELAEIEKQTGVKTLSVESPIQENEENAKEK